MTELLREPGGTVTVTAHVVERIVQRAAEEAGGARVRRARRGVAVEIAGGRASVALELVAPFGIVLPDLARDVQDRVAAALAAMCGVTAEVDVSVEELDGE